MPKRQNVIAIIDDDAGTPAVVTAFNSAVSFWSIASMSRRSF